MNISGKVAVTGVGYSHLTRDPEKYLGVDAVQACRKAIADAGLVPDDIDGLITFPEPGDHSPGVALRDGIEIVTPRYIFRALDLTEVSWSRIDHVFIGNAFIEAANAVAAGACNYALVWRALTFPKGIRYGQTTQTQASGREQFSYPYGYTGPGPASRAVIYRRYMDKYGATREDMATHIVNNRNNALLNEKGYWYNHRPEAITVDDYLNSRMVADPFCLYDCDIPVHGCAAWVLTAADRVSAAPNKPAYLIGYVDKGLSVRHVSSSPLEENQEAGLSAGKRLWDVTGLRPTDITTANVYDGFSLYVYLWLEALGFCGEGEAFEFVQDGRTKLGGKLPLNTSGGNLGEGRLHGAAHITESILQVMGRAGERQVNDASLALCAVGPPGGQTMIFSQNPL